MMTDRRSYISFNKGVSLPSLPNNFFIEVDDPSIVYKSSDDTVTIRVNFDDNISIYEYYLELVDAMNELYKWSLSLPIFS
jgi:hypothetical protein